jgi:hypothetical protein
LSTTGERRGWDKIKDKRKKEKGRGEKKIKDKRKK